MAFEEATLFPAGAAYDPGAVRDWLASCDWAFLDPVEGKLWHLSGRPRDADRARTLRLAAPDRFPLGLLVDVRPDSVYLASRADAPVLARTRTLVAYLLETGDWTVRLDWASETEPLTLERLFPEDLPDLADLVDDPLGRPVMSGQVLLWERGNEDAPGGRWAIEVHSSGAAEFSVHVGRERTHHVRGDLDPEARLAWLEAAAFVDEDDDEIESAVAPQDLVHISVENSDEEWALYLDAHELPPSVRRLGALIEAWLPALLAWKDEGLPALASDVDGP
jgi:hypothetical protein